MSLGDQLVYEVTPFTDILAHQRLGALDSMLACEDVDLAVRQFKDDLVAVLDAQGTALLRRDDDAPTFHDTTYQYHLAPQFIASSARRSLPSGMGWKRRLLSRQHAPRGGWLLVPQSQPTASPPGRPFGGNGPLDNDMRRYFPQSSTGSNPARLFNRLGSQSSGLRCHPLVGR